MSNHWMAVPRNQPLMRRRRGSVSVNGLALQAGDALKVSDEGAVKLSDGVDAEVLVFDLG